MKGSNVRRLAVLSVLVVLGFVGQAAAQSDPPAIRYFRTGARYVQAGDPEMAAKAFRASVRSNPQFAEAWALLGATLFDLDYWEEAEKCLLKAAELKPEIGADPDVKEMLALLGATRRPEAGVGGFRPRPRQATANALPRRPPGQTLRPHPQGLRTAPHRARQTRQARRRRRHAKAHRGRKPRPQPRPALAKAANHMNMVAPPPGEEGSSQPPVSVTRDSPSVFTMSWPCSGLLASCSDLVSSERPSGPGRRQPASPSACWPVRCWRKRSRTPGSPRSWTGCSVAEPGA